MTARVVIGVLALLTLIPEATRGEGRKAFGRPCWECEDVSIIQLVASPEKFEGRTVRLEGFFNFDAHGAYACLSSEAARYFIAGNCLSLTFDEEALGATEEDLQQFHLQYGLLVGVFRQDKRGYDRQAAGGLDSVTYVVGRTTDRQHREDAGEAEPPTGQPQP